jgi:hypothetical protein
MAQKSDKCCDRCKVGYYPPLDRFKLKALRSEGPTFLQACDTCGSLWHVTLEDSRHVSPQEALALYPNAKL